MSGTDIFKEVPKFDPSLQTDETPPMTNFDEFKKVIESRRSIRVFDGTAIPEEVVEKCIDMALLAPNSSNLQPWEFHWVKSPEPKKKLVEACLSQPAARTAAELIVCVGRTATWDRNRKEMLRRFEALGNVPKAAVEYYSKLAPFVYTQGPMNVLGRIKSVLFWFRGFSQPTPREPVSHGQMREWAIKSTSLACENLMLAFRAAGFDTCPMEGFDENRVRKILKLPSDSVVVMVVGAGRRSPKGLYGPQVRFDRSWFVKKI